MAAGESGLSIQLATLAAAVAYDLGYQRTPASWSGWQASNPYVASTDDSQLADILVCINHGLRMVQTPGPTEPGRSGHRWSFMSPERTLVTAASQSDYPLPDDFGGFECEMTYQASQNVYTTVRRVPIANIRRNNSYSQGLTSFPTMFCEVPLASDGVLGQRFGVAFYPTPDQAYTLTYRSNLLVQKLTPSQPYPWGGAQYGELYLAACLAAVELYFNDEPGPKTQDFQMKLQAAITADARDHRPEHLGYNGDRSDAAAQWAAYTSGAFHPWTNVVTYNGASFNP